MTREEKVKYLWDKWYHGEIPYTEYHKQLMSIIDEEKKHPSDEEIKAKAKEISSFPNKMFPNSMMEIQYAKAFEEGAKWIINTQTKAAR